MDESHEQPDAPEVSSRETWKQSRIEEGAMVQERRILHVLCACLASSVAYRTVHFLPSLMILCSRELISGESDRLLPGRTVSIGSDRVCLPASSTRLFLLTTKRSLS